MVILEKRKNDFIAGTVPVFYVSERFDDDDNSNSGDASDVDVPTRFQIDIPGINDSVSIELWESTVTAFRMRFPADREFVFDIRYYARSPSGDNEDVSERCTSAGGENEWETFTLSVPVDMDRTISLVAISGPTFDNVPDYPALRVVDLQVVGEHFDNGPGYFSMVTTAMSKWEIIPDIIGDGVSDQEDIMTAICETKGAAFDGTDCVGDLDESTVYIDLISGNYYLDGPIFVKSGVTLEGEFSDDDGWTEFWLYERANTGNTVEDAVVVIDGVTDATVTHIKFQRVVEATGDIIPGTFANLCVDVRNSQELLFIEIVPEGCRSGAFHFTDSSNITSRVIWGSTFETGNYMELTRVDNFYIKGFPNMDGLLMDTCNNIVWEGWDEFEVPTPRLSPPAGGSQTASVVITGDSSGIVFQECFVAPGAEPRILMESAMPLTLDFILEYEEAASGDCIVGVPEGSTDGLVVQVNAFRQTLSNSGDCWMLD